MAMVQDKEQANAIVSTDMKERNVIVVLLGIFNRLMKKNLDADPVTNHVPVTAGMERPKDVKSARMALFTIPN